MTKLLFTLAIVLCLLPTAGAAAVFTVTKETDDDGPCDPDTGDLDLMDDVEIRGDPLQPVVIEGTFEDERVIQTAFSVVEISNVTITGGNSLGGGGGVSIVDGDVTITACTITGNQAGGLQATISRVTVIDSTISGNTAAFRGGGIFSTGSPITPSSLTLINTTVSGNVAGSGDGIYAFDTEGLPASARRAEHSPGTTPVFPAQTGSAGVPPAQGGTKSPLLGAPASRRPGGRQIHRLQPGSTFSTPESIDSGRGQRFQCLNPLTPARFNVFNV